MSVAARLDIHACSAFVTGCCIRWRARAKLSHSVSCCGVIGLWGCYLPCAIIMRLYATMSTRIMFITIDNAMSWRMMNVFILFFIAFDIEFVDGLFIKFGFQLLRNAVGGVSGHQHPRNVQIACYVGKHVNDGVCCIGGVGRQLTFEY